MSSTPEELAALHKREYDKWAGVVKPRASNRSSGSKMMRQFSPRG